MYEHKTDPISIQRQSLRLSELPHLHKEMEIIYVEKGCSIAFADQVSYRIEEGDFFVSFPNQIHYYLDSQVGAYDVLIVNCNIFFGIKELLLNHVPENNVLHLQKDDPMAQLINQIVALPENGDISAYVGYFNLMISNMLPQLKLKNSLSKRPKLKRQPERQKLSDPRLLLRYHVFLKLRILIPNLKSLN